MAVLQDNGRMKNHQLAMDWSTSPMIMGLVVLLKPSADKLLLDAVLLYGHSSRDPAAICHQLGQGP